MTFKPSSLSLVFPCYNDAGTIGSLVLWSKIFCRGQGISKFEVVVVDDGSSDQSQLVLRELERLVPELRVVYHSKNTGYGGAVGRALKEGRCDWVFYTDGDFQYDVRDLKLLLDAPGAGQAHTVINGYKISRQDNFVRRFVGGLYAWAIRKIFKTPIRDVDCDFRLIDRRLLDAIDLNIESGAFCTELVTKLNSAGAKFIEVPVPHHGRVYGESQFFGISRIAQSIFDLIKLKFKDA